MHAVERHVSTTDQTICVSGGRGAPLKLHSKQAYEDVVIGHLDLQHDDDVGSDLSPDDA